LIAVEGDPPKDVTTLEDVKVVLKGGEVVKAVRVEGREAEVKR